MIKPGTKIERNLFVLRKCGEEVHVRGEIPSGQGRFTKKALLRVEGTGSGLREVC